MLELFDKQSSTLSAHEKAIKEQIIVACLNNYVFYLAQRGSEQERDNESVASVLPKLIKIASEREAKGERGWWNYQETVAWAKLQLGRALAPETKDAVQRLMDNPDIDLDWKKDTKARYELHNKFYPPAEKVELSIRS